MASCFDTPALAGFYRLLRLRWIACVGIAVITFLGVWIFRIDMAWAAVVSTLLLVVGSNLAAPWLASHGTTTHHLSTALIFGDILLFTALLYYTGGAHNPFTVVYLLHITLAVILLNRWEAWAAVALSVCCFAFLFTSPHMLIGPDGVALCDDLDFHLNGMLAATLVTGAGIVYFVSQLSRELLAQRELASRASQALESERRMTSLATLAVGLAHELATPLGTIAIASKELEIEASQLSGNKDCVEDAKLIRQEVERCRVILEKLGQDAMGHSWDESSSLKVSTIRERLPGYLGEIYCEKIHWHVDPRVPNIRGPENAVLRCLAVLIKNACEASPRGSSVKVVVQFSDPNVTIIVEDFGTGMEQEVLERLGEPFFTTKQAGMGMGLGFFLVRTLIEKLNGSIKVESKPTRGTRVTLSLPVAA